MCMGVCVCVILLVIFMVLRIVSFLVTCQQQLANLRSEFGPMRCVILWIILVSYTQCKISDLTLFSFLPMFSLASL